MLCETLPEIGRFGVFFKRPLESEPEAGDAEEVIEDRNVVLRFTFTCGDNDSADNCSVVVVVVEAVEAAVVTNSLSGFVVEEASPMLA
jgi:hypothetical protein